GLELSAGGARRNPAARSAPARGRVWMTEPGNPTVNAERPVDAEVFLPEGKDEDDSEEKREQKQPPQVTPPKPAPAVEDVQLKKAFELIKQTPVKAQPAQKRAAMRPPILERPAREFRIAL